MHDYWQNNFELLLHKVLCVFIWFFDVLFLNENKVEWIEWNEFSNVFRSILFSIISNLTMSLIDRINDTSSILTNQPIG